MVADSSDLVTVFRREPGYEPIAEKLYSDARVYVSSATLVEVYAVIVRRFGVIACEEFRVFLRSLDLVEVAFDSVQAELGRQAYLAYGRTRHPAALNLGDCFSYALAKSLGEPLLFTGNDFSQTDLLIA